MWNIKVAMALTLVIGLAVSAQGQVQWAESLGTIFPQNIYLSNTSDISTNFINISKALQKETKTVKSQL